MEYVAYNGYLKHSLHVKRPNLIQPAFFPKAIILLATALTGRFAAYAQSALSSGTWLKIEIPADGMYKISPADLRAWGVNPDNVDPRTIRLHGHPGGMLSELPADPMFMDPPELSIQVEGEADGRFDANDKVIFWAKGPHTWDYNTLRRRFEHQYNLYTEKTWLYLTWGGRNGERVTELGDGMSLNADTVFTRCQGRVFHEKDLYNLSISGKEWLGERFGTPDNVFKFNHNLSGYSNGTDLRVSARLCARNIGGSGFYRLSMNGTSRNTTLPSMNAADLSYVDVEADYVFPGSATCELEIEYTRPSFNSFGYLGWYEIAYLRDLTFNGGQWHINHDGIQGRSSGEWRISGSGFNVWNVSNSLAPSIQQHNNGVFRSLLNGTVPEFRVFDPAALPAPVFAGQIANQDVKGRPAAEVLIITHPAFRTQAEKLAAHRRSYNGFAVEIAEPTEIYNEFSTGRQDISAIRNFICYRYNRDLNSAHPLRYVLFVGAASYDYKDRVANNTNFIPVYQSDATNFLNVSYATDDFYGFIDSATGYRLFFGPMRVAVGRLPVRTAEEAEAVVSKIIRYESPASLGDWRNRIVFAADDNDKPQWEFEFVDESEAYAASVDARHPAFHAEKIYFDAFRQVNTGNTEAYPDAQAAINRNMERGTLFFNYMGHGGEKGWAQEEVLNIPMINAWRNSPRYSIMVTATCEFSRFDDPARQSAGEYTLLNPNGGNVALLTTTRLTYNTGNKSINSSFWKDHGLPPATGPLPTVGDLVRNVKNRGSRTDEDRKFALLGDPALTPAYPKHKVVLDFINNIADRDFRDTLKAFSKVLLEGHIDYRDGGLFSEFQGKLYATIYDKPRDRKTLANDNPGAALDYSLQNAVLYKGVVSVKDGRFSVTFIVPKDISYNVGSGKVVFYAENGATDAHGARSLLIGGSAAPAIPDKTGPSIRAFMNDTFFRDGGIVASDALFLALISDSSGINATGNGIGRDLMLYIDKGTPGEAAYILNDYYSAELNSYQRGRVEFPLKGLSAGWHTATVRVWDNFNNPGEATVRFKVSAGPVLEVSNVTAYPNPLADGQQMHIRFEHNLAGEDLDYRLTVSDLSGRLLHDKKGKLEGTPSRSDVLTWDPLSAPFSGGMAIWRLELTDARGNSSLHHGRIIYPGKLR